MPTALVIVESPAKAKTIKRYLGSDYSVEASVGHIRDIIQPKDVKNDKRYNQSSHSENNELHSFGIDISGQADPDNDWEPWYVVSGNSRKTIAKLRKALKAVDILYLATDEDREGEAIAWHLVEVLKPKIPYFRMVFHEITEKAIVAALENTREIDMNLVAAQEARRIMDRMSGFGWSGIMRQVIGGGATGGRVQSPTTRRLVERERERIRFVSADYCSLSANVLSNEEAAFTAKLIEIDGRKVVSGKSDFDESGELKKSNEVIVLREEHAGSLSDALSNETLAVRSIERSPYQRKPKPPFTTSTFQQEVINKLGGSASAAMGIAQSLYQNGFITYHRTDSTALSDQAIEAARASIETVCGAEYLPKQPRTYENKTASAQLAHEAIRPAGETFRHPDELKGDLNKDQLNVYEIIWKRTVASQMTDEKGETARMLLSGTASEDGRAEPQALTFSASGRVITHAGFRHLYEETEENNEDNEDGGVLPDLPEGENVTVEEIEVKNHSTKPPARFTESSIVKWMEEEGIGRPSTFSATIGKIRAREYIFKEGRSLVPTVKGIVGTNFLEKEFNEEVQYHYTANLEQSLDEIANGNNNRTEMLDTWWFDGQVGLRDQISAVQDKIKLGDLPELRQQIAHHIGFDTESNQNIFARFANQKPYVQYDKDGETASVPESLPPDQLTVSKAKEYLNAAAEPDQILCEDPETGLDVVLKQGSYGWYVSLGHFPKWPRASSPEGELMRLPHHLKPLKVASAYLRAIVDPSDDEAVLYILNSPKRGIGKRSIEHFQEVTEQKRCSLFEALQTKGILKPQSKAESALDHLTSLVVQYQAKQEDEQPSSLVREVLHESGYWDEVRMLKDPESKIKNLELLLSALSNFDSCRDVVDVLLERERLKNAPKPKTASLLEGMDPETLTKDQALQLLSFPRLLEPDDDKQGIEADSNIETEDSSEETLDVLAEITVHNGPYGPYLRSGDDTRSLADDDDPVTISYTRALELFAQPKQYRRRQSPEISLKDNEGGPCVDPVSENPIVLKEGRFGPYVTDGDTNASLQLGDSIEEMTCERAKELLAERRAQE